jgi:hypothetical protein
MVQEQLAKGKEAILAQGAMMAMKHHEANTLVNLVYAEDKVIPGQNVTCSSTSPLGVASEQQRLVTHFRSAP